jgi:predicted ferric reductase
MILIVRGIIWYGLYLFLILLPLATAAMSNPNRDPQPFMTEIAVGAGFVGFALMSLEFALISRIEAAAQPFGEDSLQLFHNLMGIVALGFILAHPIILIISGYSAYCWINPFACGSTPVTLSAYFSVFLLLILVGSSIWREKLRIKYELWYGLHGILALLVLFIALYHIFVIGRYTSTTMMKVVWLIYAVLVLGLTVWYKIWTPLKNWNRQWEVVENRTERGGARSLVLKPVGHDGMTFNPGQFAWIKSGRTPFGMGQHPISISSRGDVEPGGNVIFTIKNLGDWSGEQVPAIKVGERVWLDGPHGVFSMEREQGMGYVFVGGGIGITPLYSMLQTMEEREDVRPVLLFYGANSLDDMTFLEELKALSERMPNLQAIPVLTNPPDGWEGETGYVDADLMMKYLPKQYHRFKYLICGPKPLMDGMEEALPILGVPPENVLTERFDMI